MFIRRSVFATALGLIAAVVCTAQPVPENRDEVLHLHAYTLRHQPAAEALGLVRPLLTRQGSVKLSEGDNTLEIRDTVPALARILPMLRGFDHSPGVLEVEVLLVRAGRPVVSPQLPSPREMPPELADRLRELLRFDDFHLLARVALQPLEGEDVVYETGAGFKLKFRLGTLLADQSVKLHDFRLYRSQGSGQRELIHTNLKLRLDLPLALGLARSEGSHTALMVVLTVGDPKRRNIAKPVGPKR